MRSVRSFTVILVFLSVVAAGAATSLPCEFEDGLIWLKVFTGPKTEPLHFVLDSGAGRTVLDLRMARKLGVKLGRPLPVQGTGGTTEGRAVSGWAATVGGEPLPAPALALDLSGPSRSCGRRMDGLVGADFFRKHIVQIDYARRTVRLLTGRAGPAPGEEVLALVSRGDALCVRAGVAGHAPDWMRVDTGCDTALHWAAGHPVGARRGPDSIALASGASGSFSAEVRMGATAIRDVRTTLHAQPLFAGEAGLIGNGLLSRFVVTIDAERGRLILAP